MKTSTLRTLLFISACSVALPCLSDVAVIVNKSVADSMSEADISNVFLGKTKSFPSGAQAIPIDQAAGSAPRVTFYSKLTGKDDSQLKAYWSRLIFTGKGQPPKEVGGDADVVGLVGGNPNMIGYVDAGAVNDSVKVIATLK
jgi:ABC-type phosphate transport system substrate-binding protein